MVAGGALVQGGSRWIPTRHPGFLFPVRALAKVLALSVHEFIRRFLLHVLPQGCIRMRHYGLLAGRFRRQRIARCRALLAAEAPPAAAANENVRDKLLRLTGIDVTVCPACGEGRMTVVAEIDKHEAATAGVEILDSS